ncbi:MAG: hypothetical protein FWD33_00195 [Alphaproteobacteria bacterium]|nr:hypothetical protein [Alphaproteobacteria bacterium]
MTKIFVLLFAAVLAGCSSVMIKPDTMDKNSSFLVQHGGYNMRQAVKHSLEERGHKVTVGRHKRDSSGRAVLEFRAKYIVRVSETREWFNPICFFHGFYWWRFNVSISDNSNGDEILSWTARGCSATMMSKLDRYLEQLESNNESTSKYEGSLISIEED